MNSGESARYNNEPAKTGDLSSELQLEPENCVQRLNVHGVNALTDAELLSILLFGSGKSIQVVKRLLEAISSLHSLLGTDLRALGKNLRLSRAIQRKLECLCELDRRMAPTPFHERRIVRSARDAAEYYTQRHRGTRVETFTVLLLNSANQVFRELPITVGSLNASIVHPREVFSSAILAGAANVLLIHNHPSGNPEPSREDLAITKQLVEAGRIIDIKVLDHIIIAGSDFTSFKERGLI